ncbi:MAG TPA: HAMP domain-containing sensor histidine kinase [Bacillota bacterium]|nr:HAMP domain-containing sensor histidine kinase [Bacillota bacterium]
MLLKIKQGNRLYGILLAFALLVAVTLMTDLVFRFAVQEYAEAMQQHRERSIIAALEAQAKLGSLKADGLNEVALRFQGEGLVFTLKDPAGKIIRDGIGTLVKDNPYLLENVSARMRLLVPGWEGKPVKKNLLLGTEAKPVGTLTIQYVGPYFLTTTQIIFLTHIYRWILIFSVAILLGLILLGKWNNQTVISEFARITKVVNRLVNNQQLQEADFDSGRQEVKEILRSIGKLAVQMEEQEREKARITDDLAHELRTPLTTLQANLEMMAEGLVEPSPERLRSCHEEILRIIRLSGELEQLNKYESASMALNIEKFDLGDMILQLFLNFEGLFRQKGVSLKFEGSEELIEGDRDKLSQLMVNLLSNSLKHTATRGQVLVLINGNQDFIHIVINDNGEGISQHDIPHVFERLYRADNSRTRATGGTGIGLTIAKAIVLAHRGSINIVSQEGTGTEVTIVLPRKKQRSDRQHEFS